MPAKLESPWKTAEELQDPKYTLVTDSQEVAHIAELCGVDPDYARDFTAALVIVGDGDYGEVWFSEFSAPWELSAHYYPLSYYLE